jgi:hypothetical protein
MTRASEFVLTPADHSLLGPLAEHRVLIVPQVAVLLGVTERTAARRLKRLHDAGLVSHTRIFAGAPHAVRITSRGLRAAGSSLKAPNLNLNEYRHDVGVAWLWLAAGAGSFGELTGMTSDRRMQTEDAVLVSSGGRTAWGVGLGMFGSHGTPQHHYPDLMLEMASGHRVAVELELTSKSAGRMARIMRAYASDARIDHVLYLAANPRIVQRVTESARRAGIGDRVHVQLLAPDGIAGASAGSARTAPRQAGRPVTPRGAER